MNKNYLISDYFKTLNIKDVKCFDDFIDYIEKKYDYDLFQEVINELIKRIDNEENNFYNTKNSNLNISLDFCSWSYDMYKKLFLFLLNKNKLLGNKVLDLGCDNGFVLCFLGLVYNDSIFYGVDINKGSINMANELKTKLGLTNVYFKQLSVKDLEKEFSINYFDSVISIRSIREMLDLEFKDIEILKKIYCVLKDCGKFISFERILDSKGISNYESLLYRTNFKIEESTKITFYELEDKLTFPLMILNKDK